MRLSKTPLALLSAAVLCATPTAQEPCDGNIVDIATSTPEFSTLVAALEATQLVGALQGDGPLTVFAPTNQAFEKLPSGIADLLFQNRNLLMAVLLQHVVVGEVPSSQATQLTGATTVLGQRLDFFFDGVELTVGNATVETADQFACNGVVHIIDEVIVPDFAAIPGILAEVRRFDVVDTLTFANFATGEFSSLLGAVTDAGLVDALKGLDALTLFAPTDAAFAKVPQATLDMLKSDPELLEAVLLYHVVPRELFAVDVIGSAGEVTLQGQMLTFTVRGSSVFINDSQVLTANVDVSNGVFHIIDNVLVPNL